MSHFTWGRPARAQLAGRDPFTQFERLMGDFLGDFNTVPWAKPVVKDAIATFVPAIDVRETDQELTLAAELPGLDEKDVQVTVDRDTVTISGEKKFEKSTHEKDRHYVERTYGSFLRTMALPCEVDRERTAATFKKGVLEIHMPKTSTAKAQSRQIPVKTIS